MPLLVSDRPIGDVEVARKKEHHARFKRISTLIAQGHIRVVDDNNADAISVQIEGEVFSSARMDFPTIELLARVELAIAAGRSELHAIKMGSSPPDPRDHYYDAMQYIIRKDWSVNYRRGNNSIVDLWGIT